MIFTFEFMDQLEAVDEADSGIRRRDENLRRAPGDELVPHNQERRRQPKKKKKRKKKNPSARNFPKSTIETSIQILPGIR